MDTFYSYFSVIVKEVLGVFKGYRKGEQQVNIMPFSLGAGLALLTSLPSPFLRFPSSVAYVSFYASPSKESESCADSYPLYVKMCTNKLKQIRYLNFYHGTRFIGKKRSDLCKQSWEIVGEAGEDTK